MTDISHSRMQTFMQCPKKFYWHYIERWSTKIPSHHLILGTMVHNSIDFIARGGSLEDAVAMVGEYDLSAYPTAVSMRALAKRLVKTAFPYIISWKPVEDSKGAIIEREYRSDDIVGIVDYFRQLPDGTTQVVDWKTAAEQYEDHMKLLADQLTMYQVLLEKAGHRVDSMTFAVMDKSAYPVLRTHDVPRRTPEQVTEFMKKVIWVRNRIDDGFFPMNAGYQCKYCEFLPLCCGEKNPESLRRDDF